MRWALQAGFGFVDLDRVAIRPSLVNLFDQETMRRRRFLPLTVRRGQLVVALAPPFTEGTLDGLPIVTGLEVVPVVCMCRALDDSLDRLA
jgi:hypothetical protein